MKVYIATGLANHAQHNRVRDLLLEKGVGLTYDWTTHGPVWQKGKAVIKEVSVNEIEGVLNANLVIVILPGGRGTHVELGAAIAAHKPVILYCPTPETKRLLTACQETCAFYHHPNIVPAYTEQSLMRHIDVALHHIRR